MPAAGTLMVTFCPVLIPATESSGISATACQAVDTRNAMTGSDDPLAAARPAGCGPSGSKENCGFRTVGCCWESVV